MYIAYSWTIYQLIEKNSCYISKIIIIEDYIDIEVSEDKVSFWNKNLDETEFV